MIPRPPRVPHRTRRRSDPLAPAAPEPAPAGRAFWGARCSGHPRWSGAGFL